MKLGEIVLRQFKAANTTITAAEFNAVSVNPSFISCDFATGQMANAVDQDDVGQRAVVYVNKFSNQNKNLENNV
jgi:hypothetical protein